MRNKTFYQACKDPGVHKDKSEIFTYPKHFFTFGKGFISGLWLKEMKAVSNEFWSKVQRVENKDDGELLNHQVHDTDQFKD